MDAGQVAGVGQLPGQADGRVQAALELVDQPSRCGRCRSGRSPIRVMMPPAGRSCRTRPGWPGPARRCRARRSGTPAARQASWPVGWSASDSTTVEQGPALQEREPAGPEVVGQGAERLGSQGHLGMEGPGRAPSKRRSPTAVGWVASVGLGSVGDRRAGPSRRRTCRRWTRPRPAGPPRPAASSAGRTRRRCRRRRRRGPVGGRRRRWRPGRRSVVTVMGPPVVGRPGPGWTMGFNL